MWQGLTALVTGVFLYLTHLVNIFNHIAGARGLRILRA